MKLSVLIPTLNEADSIRYLKRLRGVLDPQIEKHRTEVELIINDAGRFLPTGRKRNDMIRNSVGEYFSQIDTDDMVPDYYIEELLNAIEQGPDVVSFTGFMTTNGQNRREFTIKKDEKYEERDGQYFRWCNHLCCFRRAVVEHIKFPNIWIQEDYQWSKAVRDARVLKTEVHIDKWMYHYDFKTKANARRAR